ncbi:MAG: P-type DNA transfer ATPase VirB11 [Novosphingobium sp.]
MTTLTEAVYLDSFLAPLSQWLARSDITDIYINRPQEIWIELLGGSIERHEVPALTQAALLRLARQIAARSAQGINREAPLLAASLPDGSRVQIVLPPATRGEVAIAIRRHVSAGLPLEAWHSSDIAIETEGAPTGSKVRQKAFADPIEELRDAVVRRRNILVSGGTSSGKTTLLNALLQVVPDHERLILIEDAPELQIAHANTVGLIAARGAMGEADVTAEDLLIAALRMRPDRIILGEVRGHEALTFLRAVNTGHPGSLCTIHADTPERAIDQLALLVLSAGSNLSFANAIEYIKRSIDIVVQLDRANGKRRIQSIRRISSD